MIFCLKHIDADFTNNNPSLVKTIHLVKCSTITGAIKGGYAHFNMHIFHF